MRGTALLLIKIMSKFCARSNKRISSGVPQGECDGTWAFTFAELLAALLFVAIVIPVTLQGIMIANRLAVVAERKLEAARLADMKLNELVLTGEWQNAARQGDFGSDWPEYKWVFELQTWPEDAMQQLTLRVYFSVQQREYWVPMTTLVLEEDITS